ncbi:MAG: hypothetical protein KF799_07080 [Bdellovibrionales bacterium]|nr:hypothetical protein [Bdellovibrionales bacterium]
MNRTLTSEDNRKTVLFDAWIAYLMKVHLEFDDSQIDEIYEGTAVISDLTKNTIGFHLEDGRKLRHVPIDPDISKHSCRLDMMYVILGRRNNRWWPLDVLSIGSTLLGKQSAAHITYNPLYIYGNQARTTKH